MASNGWSKRKLGRTLGVALALCSTQAHASGWVTLWLEGSHVARVGEREEWAALFGLTIAFDRIARPVVPSVSLILPLAQDAAAEPKSEVVPPPAKETTQAEAAATTSQPRWHLTSELIRAAVRAALRGDRTAAHDERLDSLSARSRSSAALPELRVGAGRSTDQSIRLTPSSTSEYQYTQAGGADLWLEARLSWKLDRLLFAREELDVERLRRAERVARWKRIERVINSLFAWQKALIEAADPAASSEQQLLAQLRAARAQAELDVLTGGWFSERFPLMGEAFGPAQ